MRKQQARNREPPHYDRKCRHLSNAEIDEKLQENDGQFVLRFALDPGSIEFKDMIYGCISNEFDEKHSDPIIMKSDGYPTYHLANVIDDHSMKISHVLRGSEWISSTTKHLLIYKAFKWNPPKFAHFPLITMKDGTKMSNRYDQSTVRFWRNEGFRPLAMVNFLTNMGGGLPKSKQDSHELWTVSKIAKEFNFDQISCNPASVDIDRLRIFNAKDLHSAWIQDPMIVINEFRRLMENNSMKTDLSDDRLLEIVSHFISRINTLKDLISTEYAYIWHPPKLSWKKDIYLQKKWNIQRMIDDIIECVSNSDLDKETLEGELKLIAQKHETEWTSVFRFVRRLLTNNDKGLPVHELISYLGRKRAIEYLRCGSIYVASL